MWADERNRPEKREVGIPGPVSEWRGAGYEDSRTGHELPTFEEMKRMAEDDGHEEFTTRDYAEYVAGYADFDDAARLLGRTLEEHREHEAGEDGCSP